jgi:hypothetical protein
VRIKKKEREGGKETESKKKKRERWRREKGEKEVKHSIRKGDEEKLT